MQGQRLICHRLTRCRTRRAEGLRKKTVSSSGTLSDCREINGPEMVKVLFLYCRCALQCAVDTILHHCAFTLMEGSAANFSGASQLRHAQITVRRKPLGCSSIVVGDTGVGNFALCPTTCFAGSSCAMAQGASSAFFQVSHSILPHTHAQTKVVSTDGCVAASGRRCRSNRPLASQLRTSLSHRHVLFDTGPGAQ
jgi:hypothetical protein